MTDADFGTPESPLLTNARRALDVARLIDFHDLAFISLGVTRWDGGGEVEAQTANEDHARALARALSTSGEEPRETELYSARGDRHLWLTVGGVRVICHQPAKEKVA